MLQAIHFDKNSIGGNGHKKTAAGKGTGTFEPKHESIAKGHPPKTNVERMDKNDLNNIKRIFALKSDTYYDRMSESDVNSGLACLFELTKSFSTMHPSDLKDIIISALSCESDKINRTAFEIAKTCQKCFSSSDYADIINTALRCKSEYLSSEAFKIANPSEEVPTFSSIKSTISNALLSNNCQEIACQALELAKKESGSSGLANIIAYSFIFNKWDVNIKGLELAESNEFTPCDLAVIIKSGFRSFDEYRLLDRVRYLGETYSNKFSPTDLAGIIRASLDTDYSHIYAPFLILAEKHANEIDPSAFADILKVMLHKYDDTAGMAISIIKQMPIERQVDLYQQGIFANLDGRSSNIKSALTPLMLNLNLEASKKASNA